MECTRLPLTGRLRDSFAFARGGTSGGSLLVEGLVDPRSEVEVAVIVEAVEAVELVCLAGKCLFVSPVCSSSLAIKMLVFTEKMYSDI